MHRNPDGRCCRGLRVCLTLCCAVCGVVACRSIARSADRYDLGLTPQARPTFAVTSEIKLAGKFYTHPDAPKTSQWTMTSTANYRYRERRLPGSGRRAAAFRSLRIYDQAESRTQVGQRTTSLQLHPQLKVVVASGQADGVELFSARHLFRRDDLDLLNVPGDSLAIQTLLPRTQVAVGDTWQATSWSLQMLCDLDTLFNGQITCELKSVKQGLARIDLHGTAEGATAGAKAKLTLDGYCLFDLQLQSLRELHLTQTEQRTPGTVSPGMNITANVVCKWSPAPTVPALTDAAAAAIPLRPPLSMQQLSCVIPESIRFRHTRNWHVYHQSRDTTILRLLDRGRLVAQCDITRLPAAQPGQHLPQSRFVADIRESLGNQLERIGQGQSTAPNSSLFRFRIVAEGQNSGQKFRWIYYLCADRSGRQTALMFRVAESEHERFAGQDQQIAASLEFLPRAPRPAATPTRPAR